MPKLLRLLTWMCFGFGLFLPLSLALIPAEGFWRRGGGPAFFLAGILFPLCGYGFVRAQNWSRYLCTALHFANVVGILFHKGLNWDILPGLIWAALIAYYLFGRRSVREYFGVDESATI